MQYWTSLVQKGLEYGKILSSNLFESLFSNGKKTK